MDPTDRLIPGTLEGAARAGGRMTLLRVLRGTVQRVDYRTGELKVVAEGRLWQFDTPADCRLCFDGQPASLRSFQPLNHVCVYYESRNGRHVARALFGSGAGAVPADPNG